VGRRSCRPWGDAIVAQHLGFMKGEMVVPKDFDEMGRDEIAALFGTAE
jgi:hypothetical protein